MLIQEIIRKKRQQEPLLDEEIEFFVSGITDESVSDSQIAAFAMSVFFNDLSVTECATLTRAMKNSGTTLTWKDLNLNGPVVDKHSTGGVGDKVSLMLAPMLAANGVYVPMISGRGLGHTGGTLDKLDAIPGYVTKPGNTQFRDVVQKVGCAIVGQTADLAPADKRFYAVRDVTATVDSLPLIVASILSKKLSAGLDALVMDIKSGSGAFANTPEKAIDLAQRITTTAASLGLPTHAVITDMNQILGRTVGNALEIREVIDYLTTTEREARLHEVTVTLGAELLVLAGVAKHSEDGRDKMNHSLDSGQAAEIFSRMVTALGGPANLLEKPNDHLDTAPVILAVVPKTAGYMASMDTRAIGNIVVELGGGRRVVEDKIDYAVGLTECASLSDEVDDQHPVALIHARSQEQAKKAAAMILANITISAEPQKISPVILQNGIQS